MNEPKRIPALLFGLILDIIKDMPLDVRLSVADLEEDEIRVLELTLGKYLQYRLQQLNNDRLHKLKEDCRAMAGKEFSDEIDEVQTVLRYIWRILRNTHTLRVIK